MDILLLIYTSLFCFLWILFYLFLAYSFERLPRFSQLHPATPDAWPRLSVIVPARNEELHIEAAARSLIDQHYPALEIILVNDRSSDRTGEIIEQLASQYPQVKALHIESLPDNWLGKVHALHCGTQQASGDWLLFTDADIHFKQGVLQKAVAYAEQEKLDHLTLMPRVLVKHFWLKVIIQAFGLMFYLSAKPLSANKPNSKNFIGIGAFNLVRKTTFEQTPGFAWLRMEPVDDMGVGLMVHKVGGQSRLAMAENDLSLGWYESIGQMFRGLEKNLFSAGAAYNPFKLALQIIMLYSLLAAPFIAMGTGHLPPLGTLTLDLLPLGLLGLLGIVYIGFAIIYGRNSFSDFSGLLLFPLGVVFLTLAMIWAGYQCIKNNGISWRGTHYAIDQLKTGQRVRF